ncbi:hypothetical protein GH714_012540 [Hevea brasiliensis]|uniref:Uncharacterized protein n=1 Tax=Hevea brasiliensis TaxID=3981 RepID=A0A6A6KE91_HEVBR|nr:hypothetical protein GH714_012540 [Hevea brasiliensis]
MGVPKRGSRAMSSAQWPAGPAGHVGAAGGQTRCEMRFIAWEWAHGSAGRARDRCTEMVQMRSGRLGLRGKPDARARFKLARGNARHAGKRGSPAEVSGTAWRARACARANEVQAQAGAGSAKRWARAGCQPTQTRFTRAGSPPKRGSPASFLPARQFSNFGRPNHPNLACKAIFIE